MELPVRLAGYHFSLFRAPSLYRDSDQCPTKRGVLWCVAVHVFYVFVWNPAFPFGFAVTDEFVDNRIFEIVVLNAISKHIAPTQEAVYSPRLGRRGVDGDFVSLDPPEVNFKYARIVLPNVTKVSLLLISSPKKAECCCNKALETEYCSVTSLL